MTKTIIYLIIFILLIIGLAYVFSLFLVQQDQIRYAGCVLLQDPKTKRVDCYGCAKEKCKDAPTSWVIYEIPTNSVNLPYACFEGESGCELAQ